MNVEERLKTEYGVDFDEVLEVWLGSHLSQELPEPYGRLCQEVVFRLPWDWDENETWDVTVDWVASSQCYASVLREEDADGAPCTITVYPALMDRLSDPACRWVFAHEFAHIASGLRVGSIVVHGKPYTQVRAGEYEAAPAKTVHEDAADRIAMEWGFTSEHTAWLAEDA